jgi:NADH-quinone oxidoreductase subunit H
MDFALFLEWLIKSLIIIFILLTGFAYLTFYERKALARIQVRIGPNRAGPGGWLQPVADGVKLIFKEELIPARAYKPIFIAAPILTVIPALIILAVMPWGGTAVIFGRESQSHPGGYQCGCAVCGGDRFHIGIWSGAGRVGFKQ